MKTLLIANIHETATSCIANDLEVIGIKVLVPVGIKGIFSARYRVGYNKWVGHVKYVEDSLLAEERIDYAWCALDEQVSFMKNIINKTGGKVVWSPCVRKMDAMWNYNDNPFMGNGIDHFNRYIGRKMLYLGRPLTFSQEKDINSFKNNLVLNFTNFHKKYQPNGFRAWQEMKNMYGGDCRSYGADSEYGEVPLVTRDFLFSKAKFYAWFKENDNCPRSIFEATLNNTIPVCLRGLAGDNTVTRLFLRDEQNCLMKETMPELIARMDTLTEKEYWDLVRQGKQDVERLLNDDERRQKMKELLL